jgi:hypothetical protein
MDDNVNNVTQLIRIANAEARVRDYNSNGTPVVVPLEEVFEGVREDDANEVVIFYMDREGNIGIASTHPADVTADLIDAGLAEWDRLLEADDEEAPTEGDGQPYTVY